MPFRPTPPPVPADLLDRFGEPEKVFGPNTRTVVRTTLGGGALLLLGAASFALGLSVWPAQPVPPSARGVYTLLAAGLFAVGGAAVYLPRTANRTWVYLCPGGVIRRRGSVWEGLPWDDVAGFDEPAVLGWATTTRQCRLRTAGGGEWGFLDVWVDDFGQLADALRRKVEARHPARR